MNASMFCLGACLTAGLLLVATPEARAATPDRPALAPIKAAMHVTPMEGIASWYGGRHAGRPTASGETFLPGRSTAAHRSLPLGTWLKVTNLKNGRHTLVKVNDRGPYVAGRLIDLSEKAARDLAMRDDGLARVSLMVVSGR